MTDSKSVIKQKDIQSQKTVKVNVFMTVDVPEEIHKDRKACEEYFLWKITDVIVEYKRDDIFNLLNLRYYP